MKQMKQVLKYELTITQNQTLELPYGAEFLSAQLQRGKLQAWFAVTKSERPNVIRSFVIVGTGNPMPEQPLAHRATVQEDEGFYVWHLFEDQLAIHQSNEIPG